MSDYDYKKIVGPVIIYFLTGVTFFYLFSAFAPIIAVIAIGVAITLLGYIIWSLAEDIYNEHFKKDDE